MPTRLGITLTAMDQTIARYQGRLGIGPQGRHFHDEAYGVVRQFC